MKLAGIISRIGKKISAGRRSTYLLVSTGLVGFIIIFIIQALIGLYSLHRISSAAAENSEVVTTSDSARLALQEQMISWQNILIRGSDPKEFNRSYHAFSLYAERTKNLLFDLKIVTDTGPEAAEEIKALMAMHSELTKKFTAHIVDMKEKRLINTPGMASDTAEMERAIMERCVKVTETIRQRYGMKQYYTTRTFITITVISFLVFIALTVYYGRQIGRRLVKTHLVLEKKVTERTKELLEANSSLQNEIEEHRATEEKLIAARNESDERRRELAASEKRYRLLVEGTRDVVFTLDQDWNFVNANNSVKPELKISPESITRYRLTDLLHDGVSESMPSRLILAEKLEESKKTKTPLSFQACLKTPNLIEPVEMTLSLEYVENNGSVEIIGKASRNTPEQVMSAFISEKCEYSIGNQLFAADEIVNRITQNLAKYIHDGGIVMIRVALREIIINAIEHGNLEITFDEKSRAMMEDSYFGLINGRQQMDQYRNRRVSIEYIITPERAIFKISDQGKGFNHKKVTAEQNSSNGDNMLYHGRGINLARSIFDEVRYNTRGNQVLLVKKLNRQDET